MLGKWENKRRTLPTPESQLRVEPETNGLLEQGSLLYLCSRMYMCARLTASSSWRPGWRHKAATQKLKLSGTVAATRRLVMGKRLKWSIFNKKRKRKWVVIRSKKQLLYWMPGWVTASWEITHVSRNIQHSACSPTPAFWQQAETIEQKYRRTHNTEKRGEGKKHRDTTALY